MLQQRVAALEQERAEFIKLKQQLEAEFNQKRAKFKELYLSKEGKDSNLAFLTPAYTITRSAFVPVMFLSCPDCFVDSILDWLSQFHVAPS